MSTAQRLDGKREADRLIRRLGLRVRRARRPVTLATILVGNRYDSALYVRLKRQAAARAGIRTEYHHLPAQASQRQLEQLIRRLNARRTINGILLQLPLPSHLDADAAIAAMDPGKDVDGFHLKNISVTPPPIAAVLRLLTMTKPQPGAFVVILAQMSVFSQRLTRALERRGFSVGIVAPDQRRHNITKVADIVVTAVGHGAQLTATDIKSGAILIDVGIRKHGTSTVGDVTRSCWKKAAAISPVPGGVGPLTVAAVLENTLTLSLRKKNHLGKGGSKD